MWNLFLHPNLFDDTFGMWGRVLLNETNLWGKSSFYAFLSWLLSLNWLFCCQWEVSGVKVLTELLVFLSVRFFFSGVSSGWRTGARRLGSNGDFLPLLYWRGKKKKNPQQLIKIREYLMVVTASACREEVRNEKSIQQKGRIHQSRHRLC